MFEVIWGLLSDRNFCMAKYLIVDSVSFGRGVYYFPFHGFIIDGYHGDGFVYLGVKLSPVAVYRFHTVLLKEFYEFIVYQHHSFFYGIGVRCVLDGFKATFKIVYYGK